MSTRSQGICKCGRAGDRVDGLCDGVVIATRWICSTCFDEEAAELEAKRGEFAELLAAGVDRAEANRIMIARNHGEAPS